MAQAELKEQIESLQKDIAQITQLMSDKAKKDQEHEVYTLVEKVNALQKQLDKQKTEFETGRGSTSTLTEKEVGTRMDELFIAKMLCTDVETKAFDKNAFSKIASLPQYADVIKATATFDAVDGMSTGGVGTGAEWIPKGFSSQLLEEIWLALQVADLFGRIQMPTTDYTLPFNPGRIIVRAGGEGTTVTKVKPTTSNLTFKASKIMSIVELTDEFEQDSLVPALNFLRKQLIDGFACGQETMCLNGDNSTNNATLYAAALDTEDCRKLVKGIRADAMSNTVAAKYDSQTPTTKGFTADNLRTIRGLMGKYGQSPSELTYILNMRDYFKALKFDAYQTLYSYGAGAVILRGELGRLDGIPLIISEMLPDGLRTTDSSLTPGGLTATGTFDGAGVHTQGVTLLVNRNGYMWGDRTEFALELWRNPLSQTTNLIGSQRLTFRKVMSDTAVTCAALYNYANNV